MSDSLLTLAHVQKSFGAARALIDANLNLQSGQITALIGENGAGKSTLVKMLAGIHQPDAGAIHLDGKPVRINNPEHARQLGISVVHQECMVFDNLSVAENLFVHSRPQQRGLVSWRAMRQRAATILHELNADFAPDLNVGQLSIAQKHVVQIARALTSDARILIMDEPTASLSHHEVTELLRITRQLKARGCAILFISHKFEEIFSIADQYAVFRDGASVAAGTIIDTHQDELIRHMVGRPVTQLFPKTTVEFGDELLRVEHLTRHNEFEDISFNVRQGEILGVYGLIGAGRTELAQVLFGLNAPDSGSMYVAGERVEFNTPAEAMQTGIALVPEDRQSQGAILPFTIAANVALPNLEQLSRYGWCNHQREAQLANDWIKTLDVKAQSSEQPVQALSGGNQQKLVIAKWLARQPRILILDEPTKGIDVNAKVAVHMVTNEFAQKGNAVIMISSDLPEILGMADRVLVMRRGRMRALLSRAEATSEVVMRAASDA